MKIADVKHNHSLTDLLKILLFTILMLAPVGMVATKCLYVIVNKNANQSYSDRYVETTQLVSNSSQFVEGQDLIATYDEKENESTTYGAYIKYNSISIDWTDYGFDEYTYTEFRLFNTGLIQLKDTNGVQYNRSNVWGNTLKSFTFNFNSFTNDFTLNGYVNYFALFYQQNTLDNVFQYSISQLEESTLFNWTENTAIFSGINAMNTQLGINSPAIGIILTYWLILTCIYVIIDIVLKLFTILTHTIGRKT